MSDKEMKACPFCGGKPEFWEGIGTQAEINCSECGIGFSVQPWDVMGYEERHAPENAFNGEECRYPAHVVLKANCELAELWNTRTPAPDSLARYREKLKEWLVVHGYECGCEDVVRKDHLIEAIESGELERVVGGG